MPLFGRRRPPSTAETVAQSLRKQGVRLDPDTRRLMDLADHLEAAVPDRQREWYQAWLAGWGKLGGTDPNAMLGRGAGVRGTRV